MGVYLERKPAQCSTIDRNHTLHPLLHWVVHELVYLRALAFLDCLTCCGAIETGTDTVETINGFHQVKVRSQI
jgi:hypothetical protein